MISCGVRWTLDITTSQAEKMKYVRTYITCISKNKRVNPNKTEFYIFKQI